MSTCVFTLRDTLGSRMVPAGAAAHGTADLKPEAMDVTAHAPTLDVQARLYMQPPDWAALRQATSQAEVSALAKQVGGSFLWVRSMH